MNKTFFLALVVLMTIPLASAYSFIDEKGLVASSIEIPSVLSVEEQIKLIPESATSIKENWASASIEVTPAIAQSWKDQKDFMQNIEVCNKQKTERYFWIVPEYDNLKSIEYLHKTYEQVKMSSITYDCHKKNVSTSVYSEVLSKNVSTIIEHNICDLPYTTNYTTLQPVWAKLNDNNFVDIKTESSVKVVYTDAFFLKPNECTSIKSHFVTYKPTGKYDLRVYGSDENDWSCIHKESCDFSYVLDPWYDSYSLKYKRARQLVSLNATIASGVSKPIPILVNFSNATGLCNSPLCRDYFPTNDSTGGVLMPYELDSNITADTTNKFLMWVKQDLKNNTVTYDLFDDSTIIADLTNLSGTWSDYVFVSHQNNLSASQCSRTSRPDCNATVVGAPVTVKTNNVYGIAQTYRGATDGQNFGNDYLYKMNINGTVMVWANYSGSSGVRPFIIDGDFSSATCGWGIGDTSLGGITCRTDTIDLAITDDYTAAPTISMYLCQWNCTLPAGPCTYKTFFNGKQMHEGTTAGVHSQCAQPNLTIGFYQRLSSINYYCPNCTIDEVRIANYTMTPQEIMAIYQQGKDIYNTFNGSEPFGSSSVNFTINAYNNLTGVAILKFNATVNGTTYTTTTGNITLPSLTGGIVTINVSSPFFFNTYQSAWNTSQKTYNSSHVKKWVLTAKDYNYNTTLTDCNITIDSTVKYNLSLNCTIESYLGANETTTHTLSYNSPNYTQGGMLFNEATANTTNNNSEYSMRMWQSEVHLTASEKVSYLPITGGSYLTAWGNNTIQKIPAGITLVTFNKGGYYYNAYTFVFYAGENVTADVPLNYNRIINITAYNVNSSNILYFNSSIVSNDFPTWTGETNGTTTGVATHNLVNGSYNITISSGGYWSENYVINTTNWSAIIYPYRIKLEVRNVVSGNYVTAYNTSIMINNTLINYTTTSYNTTILSDLGIKTVNVSKAGYQTGSITLNLSAFGELNLTMNLSPYITFTLYNESTGGLFNPNTTSGVLLRIFCNSTTLEWSVVDSIGLTPIGCQWSKMRLYVTYGNTTYFRTLMPEVTATNVSWYLIDLTAKTAVQKIFYLNDLAQQYNLGRLKVDKIVGTQEVTINEEAWDIERKDIVYFILYDPYILILTDNSQVTRSLGYFYADSQATHTITVPTIEFSPSQTVDDFQYGYIFTQPTNVGGGSLYMNYQSTGGTLYSVNWLVRNASNTSQIFLNTSFITTTGSSNFTGVANGTIYLSQLTFNHSSYSSHTDQKVWNDIQNAINDVLEGLKDPVGFKKWFSFISIVGIALLFSGLSMTAGAAATAIITAMFYGIGWLPISAGLFGLLMVIAVIVAIIGEGIR